MIISWLPQKYKTHICILLCITQLRFRNLDKICVQCNYFWSFVLDLQFELLDLYQRQRFLILKKKFFVNTQDILINYTFLLNIIFQFLIHGTSTEGNEAIIRIRPKELFSCVFKNIYIFNLNCNIILCILRFPFFYLQCLGQHYV